MSLFQRRHYNKIGDLLIEIQGYFGLTDEVFEVIAGDFADMFIDDNPKFNYNLFYEHLGINAE